MEAQMQKLSSAKSTMYGNSHNQSTNGPSSKTDYREKAAEKMGKTAGEMIGEQVANTVADKVGSTALDTALGFIPFGSIAGSAAKLAYNAHKANQQKQGQGQNRTNGPRR